MATVAMPVDAAPSKKQPIATQSDLTSASTGHSTPVNPVADGMVGCRSDLCVSVVWSVGLSDPPPLPEVQGEGATAEARERGGGVEQDGGKL